MVDRVDITLTDRRTGTIAPELFGCLIENYGTLLDGIWKRFSTLSKAGGVISNDIASASEQGMDIEPGGKLHMLGLKYPREQDLRDTIAMIDEHFDGGLELCVEEWEGQTRFTCGWPQEWLDTMSVFEIVLHQGRASLKYENEARLDGGLKVSERMHWWMRHAERVKMATYLYPTNTWAPLLRTSAGISCAPRNTTPCRCWPRTGRRRVSSWRKRATGSMRRPRQAAS